MVTGYLYSIPSLIFLYVTCNVQFRYEVLNELMENLLEEGEMEDADFQRKIFSNLKLCIMVHNQNKRLACRMLDLTGGFTLCLCLLSIVSFAALSFFVLTNISPKSNIRILVSLIVNIITLLILCEMSDKLYVVSTKLFENGINCPWWNWNKENRKILLIFLINASKPIRINGFNIIDANYALILRVTINIISVNTLKL
ncbi:odorant receptor 43a-like [Diabrotica virgifera virgifera]|uniref:Odorant receptor 43a-like n=1 Tax=Diabrotica virgifera virgifera TaxID=50390 RepID=A0A6P7FKZ4_DIAVI|nr:odorant receptor 43a-like [Diabrotica virgifera virgifera]